MATGPLFSRRGIIKQYWEWMKDKYTILPYRISKFSVVSDEDDILLDDVDIHTVAVLIEDEHRDTLRASDMEQTLKIMLSWLEEHDYRFYTCGEEGFDEVQIDPMTVSDFLEHAALEPTVSVKALSAAEANADTCYIALLLLPKQGAIVLGVRWNKKAARKLCHDHPYFIGMWYEDDFATGRLGYRFMIEEMPILGERT